MVDTYVISIEFRNPFLHWNVFPLQGLYLWQMLDQTQMGLNFSSPWKKLHGWTTSMLCLGESTIWNHITWSRQSNHMEPHLEHLLIPRLELLLKSSLLKADKSDRRAWYLKFWNTRSKNNLEQVQQKTEWESTLYIFYFRTFFTWCILWWDGTCVYLKYVILKFYKKKCDVSLYKRFIHHNNVKNDKMEFSNKLFLKKFYLYKTNDYCCLHFSNLKCSIYYTKIFELNVYDKINLKDQ